MSDMTESLDRAWQHREPLVASLAAEETDSYRLFHGATEGCPGLNIDRYGGLVFVQSFYEELNEPSRRDIGAFFEERFGGEMIYKDRSRREHGKEQDSSRSPSENREFICREGGTKYVVYPDHKGLDPGLFLDTRAARRVIRERACGQTVLNLFAYTCSLGMSAQLGGAREVTHLDFSRTHLDMGRRNASLNGLDEEGAKYIVSDYFPAIRQFAGLPIKSRSRPDPRSGKKQFHLPSFPSLQKEQFDQVLLDPPPWSKTFFGTVDLTNDYQSVFKPALLATKPGGVLFCTNNVAKVTLEDWRGMLFRCAEKAGRPIRECEFLTPESDFPSPDDQQPLKMVSLLV